METRSEIEVKLSDKVKVFFTTRVDGFSKGDFSSNNLGLHVHDDNETVLKNRLKLEDAVGKEILFMNQTHSDRVLFVGAEHFVSNKDMAEGRVSVSLGPDCDGMVTDSKDFALAVLTADCLPLILYTEDGSIVAAVHCGWKGVYRGIVNNALETVRQKSSSPVHAYCGPCIGPESFEVSEDLLFKFSEVLGDEAKDCFTLRDNGKYLCSLPGLVELNLKKLSVNSVTKSNIDNFKETELLYSYRRSAITGRMATVITAV